MIFVDKMQNLKIYKTNTFLPTIEGDKKKYSALLLLTPTYQSTLKMMNYHMFINKLRFESYYFDKGVSYYINGTVSKEVDEEDESLNEDSELLLKEANEYILLESMSAEERNKLPDSAFGLPKKRKYPLDTEAHVKSAIRFFNYVDKEDEEELARNIIKAIKKFGMHPNVGKNNRFRKYYTPVNEFTFLKTAVDDDTVIACEEESVPTLEMVNDSFYNGINTGDKIIYFGEQLDSLLEATNKNDTALKKILFTNRMRKRKEVLLRYEQLKKDCPFIKYTYPELNKYRNRNVYVDLSYYMNIFLQNNTWTMMRGFNLFYQFMNRLINNPGLNTYSKKTIIIPILDWDRTHDDQIWNYRKSISPLSIIYQLMYTNNEAQLNDLFKDHDVLFVGNNKYFKMNFQQMKAEGMDLKKWSSKFKIFIMKLAKNEEFPAEDIDDAAEHNDSKEVIRAKIADKIETSKGVDITPELHRATVAKAKINKAEKPLQATKVTRSTVKSVIKTNATIKANVSKATIDKEEKEVKTFSKTALTRDPMEDQTKSINKVTKKQKLADDIEDIIDNVDTEEELYNDMNDNDDLLDALADLDSEETGVDVSVGRSSRMNKLDEELLKKSVRGKTVEEILSEDTINKETKPLNIPVAGPNKEDWANMKYAQFDKGYNIQKDILKIFKHFTTTSVPMAIRNIEVKDNSTSEDRLDLYTVEMEDFRGKRFTIKLDIPVMVDNRFLIRGNNLAIQNQFFNMPILKTEAGVAQIISNYNKIFVYNRPRGSQKIQTGKSTTQVNMFLKAANKYSGTKIKFYTGDNIKISNKYILPIDYIDIGTVYNRIESKNFIFYFNQDEIREKYKDIIDLTKPAFPYGYNKRDNTIIYFYDQQQHTFVDDLLNYVYNDEDWVQFVEEINKSSRPNSNTYSRCSIMSSTIPTIVICGLHEGLRSTLDKAKIEYELIDKIPTEKKTLEYDWVKFKDGYVLYRNTYEASMLLNGLKVCDTINHSITEVDSKPFYLECLDNFGGRIKADGLENFKDLLIDPITKEILEKYKMPTDYVSILLYANALLCDNKYYKHTDTSSRRIRRYEMIAVYTYKALANAYNEYAYGIKHLRNASTMNIKQSAVVDMFITDCISSNSSCINALYDVETTNSVTTKGPSGMNSDRAYSLDKRGYDDSMRNILGMSTGFAGNSGVTRQTTLNANIDIDRGFVKASDGSIDDMNTANSLTMTEALTPFGSTHDSPMRTAMTFIQTSKHMVRTTESDPLLVTNGADEALPYLTTDKFAFKAKQDGTVKDYVPNQYIVLEYKDGTCDYINLEETIEQNYDGGYFVPLKLDCDPKMAIGKKFKANDILAYDKSSFSNNIGESDNIAFNVGKLAKVAILNSDENFEDSGVITESMAEKLATRINLQYSQILDKEVNILKYLKVGDKVECGDDLILWQAPFKDEDADSLMTIMSKDEVSDLGKRRLTSEVTGVITAIKIYRTIELEEMTESMKKMVAEYERPIKAKAKVIKDNNLNISNLPAHYKLPATGKLKKAQEAILVEYYVEYLDTVGIGDKIVYFDANKGVEKAMIPRGKEPYTAFRPNEPVDAFVGDVSISKRIVGAIPLVGAINKAMIELDRSVKDIMGIKYDDSTV